MATPTSAPFLDKEYHFSARLLRVLACRKYSRCNVAICSPCQYRKSLVHAAKVRDVLEVTTEFDALLPDPVRLHRVVLTQRDRAGTLRERINSLYNHLAEFNEARGTVRSKYVLGGVWRLHVGHRADLKEWNPHFDTLLETRAMPTGTIEQEWRRISGGIAHVQTVTRSTLSFERISNYVTKLPFHDFKVIDADSACRNGDALDTYADAVGHRRKIDYIGTWRRRPRRPSTAGSNSA